MTFDEAIKNPLTIKVEVLEDDIAGRYKAGEIGVMIKNNYAEKYDHMVWLPPLSGCDACDGEHDFMARIDAKMREKREFYFYDHEVKILGPVMIR